MNIATLYALKAYCRHTSDTYVIDELIDDNKTTYHGPFTNPLNNICLTYYWTYGSIREEDLPVVRNAFDNRNYKLWDDCRLVYPDNLPQYAYLYLPNIDDIIPIEVNPFTYSLIDVFDGEHG